jgi:hypothetical protein
MKGSTFKTMLNTDKYRNEPCPTCHQLDSPKKVAEKITIESCTDLAKKIGYKCLSTQYVNINELLEWQCNHGHTLAKSYRQMVRNQTGNYCATCSELHLEQAPSIYKTVVIEELKASKVSRSSNGEVRDYNWLNEFATDHKLVLLENHYLGMDVKHDFKCIKGHEFNSTVTNLMEKKERGTSLCNHVECNGVNVINLETCREFAKSNSLECLSIEYKNVNEKMKWKCSHNHEFEKTYRQFLRSKTKNYCPDCA